MSTDRERAIPVVAMAVACSLVTALVFAIPPIRFGYPVPAVTVFVAGLLFASSLSIAMLFVLRHETSGHVSDLLVALVFAVSVPLELLMPIAEGVFPSTSAFAYWCRFAARLLIAAGLCKAAWIDHTFARPVKRNTTIAIALAGAALLMLVTLLCLPWLPPAVAGSESARAALLTNPIHLLTRLAGAALLLAAAVGFTRRALRKDDEVPVWLAVATVGLGASLFHEFLYPSMHTDWLTTADLLRVGARGVLVVAAVSELARIWKHRISDARTRERQRMAAELHDGLAQELAFLSAQSALVCDQAENNEALRDLRAAAERALVEARRAIAAYSEAAPVALDQVLLGVARDVERRYRCTIGLDLAEVVVDAQVAHELERTAREALTNAARHSEGASISLHLEVDKRALSLRVSDDGIGMPVGGHDADSELHYGMTAMTTRAARLHGTLRVLSERATGTTIAVEVPLR